MSDTRRLDRGTFLEIVRNSPLVSVDFVVRDERGRMLVGLRNNEPAKDCWFVPGGRICKDERIVDAQRRVAREELGIELDPTAPSLLGVYEHLYDSNFAGAQGFGTHYVVLAYELRLSEADLDLERSQHRDYRWLTSDEVRAAPDVHPNTKAYA